MDFLNIQRPISLKGAGIQNSLRGMTPPKNEKESGSYFFNYFEFLLLSEIEAAVCQSQLITCDEVNENSPSKIGLKVNDEKR